jgi:DNA-binding XRE family transcriptional regulator
MTKNWDRPAMRFAAVTYANRQGMLDVTFENGDHFLVATESVLPIANNAPVRRVRLHPANRTAPPPPLDWAKLRIGETGDVLEVPALGAVIEIAWDRIRSIADPDFRAHLANQAAKRARRIGSRVRALRRQAGLTRAALADKVGVAREAIAGLETGKIETQIDLIEHIATALGKRLGDFAEE